MAENNEVFDVNANDSASSAVDNAAPVADTGGQNVRKAPFSVVESYKSIRTNLMFMLPKEANIGNVIAITSPNASEGKSTTAVNIAIAFSQLEKRILLIDGDMRRSSVHKKLKLENETGLSNVLAGFCTFDEAVVNVSSRFHVLTAGKNPPNPSELLDSDKFKELIDLLRSKYAYIIIDTPPVNVVSDALVIAPNTEGLLMVIRDGATPNYAIKRAITMAEFAKVKILGAVMNGANPRSGKRYIYRKYSYRSQYYNYNYAYSYRNSSRYGYGSESSNKKKTKRK